MKLRSQSQLGWKLCGDLAGLTGNEPAPLPVLDAELLEEFGESLLSKIRRAGIETGGAVIEMDPAEGSAIVSNIASDWKRCACSRLVWMSS